METTQMTVNLNGATYGICANPTDDGFFLLTVAELNDDGAPFRWLCDEGDGQIYESARGATIAGVHYVA